MDPIILKKLNKVEHYNEYGYDEKADIWSLGTICYEMLVGRNAFDAESMKDLLKKVSKGNYSIPTTLSKEAASFLIGMLQFDTKKRFTAEKLYRHKFLNKKYNELQKINLKEVQNHIKGSRININANINQSIIDAFGIGVSVIMEEPDDDLPEVLEYKLKEEKEENKEKEEKPKDKKLEYKRVPSKVIKLNDKALEQKFLEDF